MSVYITNLKGFGQNSVAELAQQMVARIGCQNLGMTELGIKFFNWSTESPEERNAHFAGIVASLSPNDTVILQSPTWIAIEWDGCPWRISTNRRNAPSRRSGISPCSRR